MNEILQVKPKSKMNKFLQAVRNSMIRDGQLGGYVHDTAMAQYLPPTFIHLVTGTWSMAAGQTAGTVAMHLAAAAQTVTVNIPIEIPSNAVSANNKGSYLKSIEVDFWIGVVAMTSITPTLNLITRNADGSAPTVAAQTITYLPAQATLIGTGYHKMVNTLTTPIWLANTQYALLSLSIVQPATATLDLLSAVVNFTARM
ncbi:MAG: hypothetical protein WCE68_05145 [Anaerolineales bacterium]